MSEWVAAGWCLSHPSCEGALDGGAVGTLAASGRMGYIPVWVMGQQSEELVLLIFSIPFPQCSSFLSDIVLLLFQFVDDPFLHLSQVAGVRVFCLVHVALDSVLVRPVRGQSCLKRVLVL